MFRWCLVLPMFGLSDRGRRVDAMHLEHALGKINADRDNLHLDSPPQGDLSHDHPRAHRCLSGRRPTTSGSDNGKAGCGGSQPPLPN